MIYLNNFQGYLLIEYKKMYEFPYPNCGSVIKSLRTEKRESINGTNVWLNRGYDEYVDLC